MTTMSGRQAAYPAWVPRSAQLYLAHTETGVSLREIARGEGCHPSTVLRKVRTYENRRDDPLIDDGLSRIGAALHMAPAASRQPPTETEGIRTMTAPARTMTPDTRPLADEATLQREARRVLRRLAEAGTVLAVSSEMDKAVVMKGAVRMAVLERHIAEAFAIKGWIEVHKPGRITTYALTTAGRVMLRRMFANEHAAGAEGMAEAPADFAGQCRNWGERAVGDEGQTRRLRVNLSESPVAILARRREKDGSAFLPLELVEAAERLREDFELAQIAPRLAQNWDRFLTGGDRGAFREALPSDGAMRARDRVAAAVRDLGPGLGDVALRCCCYLEGLEAAEKRMGWSARSGKIVLRIALIRLKRHYDETYGGKRPLIG